MDGVQSNAANAVESQERRVKSRETKANTTTLPNHEPPPALPMLRLQDNPPMKLPSLATLDEAPGIWTPAYCKPRQEKALARDLCRLEVPYFLPMLLREKSSGGRRRRTMEPMFRSYLFFAGEEPERLALLKTNRIVQLVKMDPLPNRPSAKKSALWNWHCAPRLEKSNCIPSLSPASESSSLAVR